MKKFIKFTMSTKDTFTLPIEQAEEILRDPANIVMISKDGEWSGETINKSFIISTKRDFEKEREYKMYDEKTPQLEERNSQPIVIKELLEKNKPQFLK
jgi:hypothetical protein